MFLTLSRNMLFLQQMFPRLRAKETIFSQQCFRNSVSSFTGAFKHNLLWCFFYEFDLQIL